MQTPEEFMAAYFAAEAKARDAARLLQEAMREKFFSANYGREIAAALASFQYGLETILSAESTGEKATVFITEARGTRVVKRRYLLQRANEQWEIHAVEDECFFCRGTGFEGGSKTQAAKAGHFKLEYIKGGQFKGPEADKAGRCSYCKGIGWTDWLLKESRKRARKQGSGEPPRAA